MEWSKGTGAEVLARLVDARSIAIVGASQRNLIARIALANLRMYGSAKGHTFGGRVVGVHPSGGTLEGFDVVPSLGEAGDVDVALLALGARNLVAAIGDAATAGVTTVIVPGAGANEGGREIEDDLRSTAAETGVTVIGPNCMGVASLATRVVPYVGTLDPDLREGRVALVSQSGSVCELFTALPDRIGFSHVLSLGNEMGIDTTDAIELLAADPRTEVVGLFVEGVRRPRAFHDALRTAAEAGKTVVALKVGRSERARAGTVAHTGALAGDADVFSAVLRDAGAIEVTDLDEMFVMLELLGKGLTRPAARVVYVGDSGGQANLFADLAADRGVDLPPLAQATNAALHERFPSLDPEAENPLDLWALGDPEAAYGDALPLIVEHEPHLVVFGVDKFLARTEPEVAFVRAGIKRVDRPGAVILLAYAGSDSADSGILRVCWERRVPVVRGAGTTLGALAAIAKHARPPQHDRRERPATDTDRLHSLAATTTEWSEHVAKQLLRTAGIPVTREREVGDATAAVEAARAIGYPVVVKVAGPDVAHKTEMDGVRLGLSNDDEVRRASDDLSGRAPRLLVSEQRAADVELIVSSFTDEQFGPCALIGLGGIWAEAFRETAVLVGPGSHGAVVDALSELRWGPWLLEGGRGHRFPVEAIADAVLRLLDALGATEEHIDTIEINPLFVDRTGVVAVDALVVSRKEAP